MPYNKFKVVILILNWNSWQDTIECLESLYQIEYYNYQVIVVDNGSEDESLLKIKEYCDGKISIKSGFFRYNSNNKPIEILEFTKIESEGIILKEIGKINNLQSDKKIIIIKNKKNYGFTKGNNIGIKFALKNLNPEYILLLNNDTVVESKFLKELSNSVEKYPKVGFISPKIYFYDYYGKKNIIQYAGAKQNLWFLKIKIKGIFEEDKGQYDYIEKTECPHGSCLLAKVEMIKEIGLLDEDFFSYREENDWCIRGYENGWESIYVPSSKIWHKGGKSSGGSLSPLSVFYMTRNDFLLIKKHGNIIQIILFFLYFIFFKLWFLSGVYLVYKKNYEAFYSFLKGAEEGILWKEKN